MRAQSPESLSRVKSPHPHHVGKTRAVGPSVTPYAEDPLTEVEKATMHEYIGSVRWREAKTGPPHSYTVRAWDERSGPFEEVVRLIRSAGHIELFFGVEYTYLSFRGLKYWTMGAPLHDTIIINRAAVDAVYGQQPVKDPTSAATFEE